MKEISTPALLHSHPEREEPQADLSVAEAIYEAMQTSASPPPLPEPHLPLRKASVKKLQQQGSRTAPTPLWALAENHKLRGFSPSPVQALPEVNDVQASSEHAFAGREERGKRPFKPPLGVLAMRHGQEDGQRAEDIVEVEERPGSSQVENAAVRGSRLPSSPLIPPPIPQDANGKQQKRLRSSKSLGEGLKGWRHRFSAPNKGTPPVDRDTMYSMPVTRPSVASIMAGNGVRDSYRSAVTSHSSFLNTSSINTEHSSLTGDSSQSDLVQVFPNWPETDAEGETEAQDEEVDFTVEDAIGLYADGFDSAKPSMDTQGKRSFQTSRPTSQPSASNSHSRKPKRPNYGHRRSQSATILEQRESQEPNSTLAPPAANPADHKRTFTRILSAPVSTRPNSTQLASSTIPRDRYGFKKSTHYITEAQYDAWNATYTQHLARRLKKWKALMSSYGLSTSPAYRFPPKSDKVKRYVRKGIPPEFRGAAWFWYAGGPGKLAKEPGLYFEVLQRVQRGELKEGDREHIERDLNRTFPDNVRFKPDPSAMMDAQAGAGGGGDEADKDKTKRKSKRQSIEPETPILQSLRRLLQAFAVHNPTIGYCQSLNFIAGLLLLFLDEDEEKAFILLNIVTTQHLPGTHGVALEGANIDIAVLMSCIKDSLPQVWAKLDDKTGSGASMLGGTVGGNNNSSNGLVPRLPTVSLATTAWFMSLFVGTLPIESVLRVWDCLFFEGSKTLFRIALAIFKLGERKILQLNDPMEIFQLVQTLPRGLLDVNSLMAVGWRRRGGFGHVSQGVVEGRREERRRAVRGFVEGLEGARGWRGWRARFRGRTRTEGLGV